jgi:NADH-quinone oxidoreductase subunit J
VNLQRLRELRIFGVQWPMAVVVGLLFIALIGFVVTATSFGPTDPIPGRLVDVEGQALGNSEAVAWMLYREYFVPFEIASLFLLVAMIGAVVLAKKD